VHDTIANKYSFKYHGRKITLIPMSATEILEADLERDERRKSELFRREWAVLNVSTLSSKSGFVQNKDLALSFVGPNILHHVSNEEQQIEEQCLIIPPSMPNILQDFGDYKQHETNEEEDIHTVFGEISEPTLPLPSTEIEIIDNNICETLQGENPFFYSTFVTS